MTFSITDWVSRFTFLCQCGQVKLALTHHTLSSDGTIQSDKPLTFLMDPVKETKPPKKKQKKQGSDRSMTSKNFGSVLDIPMVKKARRLLIGWRMRHPFNIALVFEFCSTFAHRIKSYDKIKSYDQNISYDQIKSYHS